MAGKVTFAGLFDTKHDAVDVAVNGRDVRLAVHYLLDYSKMLRQQGHDTSGLECNGLAVRLLGGPARDGYAEKR